MTELHWQKSSFSTGGSGECVELAIDPTGHPHLRESNAPSAILARTGAALRVLLRSIKATAAAAPAPRA